MKLEVGCSRVDLLAPPAPMASAMDVAARRREYEAEIEGLMRFFDEEEPPAALRRPGRGKNAQRKKIATSIEGSRLPYSALVAEVFDKMSGENDEDQGGALTTAAVRSAVLSVGERVGFGITKPDSDVLEDDAPGELWRWQVREAKLLPSGARDEVLEQRRWRRKIGDRIAALSTAVEMLRGPTISSEGPRSTADCLAGTEDEAAIRAAKAEWHRKKTAATVADAAAEAKNPLVEQPSNVSDNTMRTAADPGEKGRVRQERLVRRMQDEAEKEQRRREKEEKRQQEDAEKEQRRREKEEKRQQDEAEKEQRRREREEKRQQDEAEKEQRRREKEEKMRRVKEGKRQQDEEVKKQASFMDRFLGKRDTTAQSQSPQTESSSPSPVSQPKNCESGPAKPPMLDKVVSRMDSELKKVQSPDLDALKRLHFGRWVTLRHHSRELRTWGVRRKPKVSVYRELRLQSSQDETVHSRRSEASSSQLKRGRENAECEEDASPSPAESSPKSALDEAMPSNVGRLDQLCGKRRKLLQFDKSPRPPYYGTYSKTSTKVKPRVPLARDPSLDYDVDSEDEWVEENPGESLSDVEEMDEAEDREVDEVDNDDEFFVPDGYLSAGEGVAMEDPVAVAASPSSSHQPPIMPVQRGPVSQERLRRFLDDAIEHALSSDRPLVISNFGTPAQEDDASPPSQFPSRRPESSYLEALRMCVLAPIQIC